MTNHLATVQGIYQAFGRGDVPAILDQLADDVVWEYGSPGHGVPWLQPRRGKGEVPGFFQAIGEQLDITMFSVEHLLASDAIVVALIDIEATVKPTGKTFVENHEVHIWHFDASGKVCKFRHAVDTHAHWLATQR